MKEDGKFYHEGHEEHEVKKFKIFTSEPFGTFVFFVVRSNLWKPRKLSKLRKV